MINNKNLTPQKILDAVCDEYNTTKDAILGRSRLKDTVLARQMANYLLRYYCRLESTKIADIMGRFYTTVDFSIHQVEDMLRFNLNVQEHFKNIQKALTTKQTKSKKSHILKNE